MKANFPVVLDACVIAHYTVCDLLLRLAEHPPLFSPRWSDKILQEVQSVQTTKFKKTVWTIEDAQAMRAAMETAFPEAMVQEAPGLESTLLNHEKDRHVLATAITGRAEVICTYNLKDFPVAALASHNVRARHPADFLIDLYTIDPGVVVAKLSEMANKRKIEAPDLVKKLSKQVPAFSVHVAEALGWCVDFKV